jgi:DNA-binding transcriptional MocR family regulator
MQRAAAIMLPQLGGQALSYGAGAGPGTLIAWLVGHLQRVEAHPVSITETLITGGNSDAIDQLCTLCTQPGDVVFAESPTYHLAIRILRDHPLDLRPAPADEHGLQVDVLADAIARLRREGRRPRMLYTVPTFHNPTGVSLSDERRRALIELAEAEGMVIVEDDVYRELVYDGTAPASLWSLAPRGVVVRLGSFAKSLAPGLRLGWLNAEAALIERFVNSGLRDSAGGTSHFAGMVVAAFCESGAYDELGQRFRAEYRRRRDTLLDALAEHLPATCSWTKPAGGYFVWINTPVDTVALLPRAEAAGVGYVPGSKFHIDGRGQTALRLAFSLYPPDQLAEGARRLGQALKEVV